MLMCGSCFCFPCPKPQFLVNKVNVPCGYMLLHAGFALRAAHVPPRVHVLAKSKGIFRVFLVVEGSYRRFKDCLQQSKITLTQRGKLMIGS